MNLKTSISCLSLAIGLLGLAGNSYATLTSPFEIRYISGLSDTKSFGDRLPAGGYAAPPQDWQKVSFDDSTWSTARNSYPAPLSPVQPIETPPNYVPAGYVWHFPVGAPDGRSGVESAYFRMSFFMPNLAGKAFPYDATLKIVADDDVEAWIGNTDNNGNPQVFKVVSNADYGTQNDRGADWVHTVDVTPYLRLDQTNVLAIHATDGNLANPQNVLYEHLAFQLRIHTVPEPGSIGLALVGLMAALGLGRRRLLF